MVMTVTIVGIFGVIRALKISNPREKEQIISEGDDWISKFVRKGTPDLVIIESPKMDIDEFEKGFFGEEGRPESQAFSSVDEKILNSASEILDRSKEDYDIEEALRMAGILEEQDILHPDNIILDIDVKDQFSEENNSDNQVPSDFDLEI